MRVYPKPLEIGDEEGFTPEKDIFGKAELGAGMTHLVENVDDPLVIAFDGPWGSGKTTFLRMWAGELRKKGFKVIFFDAFENDYVEDPFAALVREVVALAEGEKSPQSDALDGFKEKAVRLGGMLLKGTTKVALKVGVRAITAGLVDTADLTKVGDDISDEVQDIAEEYMSEIIEKSSRQKEVIDSFKSALSALPEKINTPESAKVVNKLIFIVDELDRCKPVFALSLLERIKHFMSVNNVHFVLGVNLLQISNSVRYAYGEKIDAISYLQKFINITVENRGRNSEEENLRQYTSYLLRNLKCSSKYNGDAIGPSIDTIVRVVQNEKMSYRTIERAFTILSLVAAFAPQYNLPLGPVMGGLIMMKLIRPEYYDDVKRNSLTMEQAREFLRFPYDPYAVDGIGHEEEFWEVFLLKEIPDRLKQMEAAVFRNRRARNRQEVLRQIAINAIDVIKPS